MRRARHLGPQQAQPATRRRSIPVPTGTASAARLSPVALRTVLPARFRHPHPLPVQAMGEVVEVPAAEVVAVEAAAGNLAAASFCVQSALFEAVTWFSVPGFGGMHPVRR